MIIARTRTELRQCMQACDPSQVGLVPTMGALHEGHLSLVGKAREMCGTVVVSVFVNPTQFNDPNDLANYPRTEQRDAELLEAAGVDVVFMPTVEEMYPQADTRVFDFGNLDKVMEGATRPGHFNGVAQIVSKLFEAVKPAKAFFGEKDFQQIAVVRAMTRKLDAQPEIVACPIVREADGLAMSSRNTLLTKQHREAAPKIYAALKEGVEKAGTMSPVQAEEYVTEKIDSEPLLKVIYFKIVDAQTLEPVTNWQSGGAKQGCVAVQAGSVRLIDNIRFV